METDQNIVYAPISIGEALDKMTILKIKQKYICDESKLNDISLEIRTLMPIVDPYIQKVPNQYHLLYEINERVWKMIDEIRQVGMSTTGEMKENDARFRVKKKINILTGSLLKEQKNFGSITDTITISEFNDSISKEIRTKSVYCDVLNVHVTNKDVYDHIIHQHTYDDDPWINIVYKHE